MNARIRKISSYGGYALFTILLFFYFSFLTFPYETITHRYLAHWTQALPYRISVKRVQATPLLWISVSGVRILPPAGTETKPLVEIPEARFRPSWLSFLIGRPALRVKASLYGGQIMGRAGKGNGRLNLSMHWKAIHLEALPLQILLPGTQLQGRLRGDLDLQLGKHDRRLTPTRGALRIHIEEGAAKNIQLRGFPLPSLEGINGDADLEVAQAKVTLNSLSLNTNLLNLLIEGKIDLSPRPRSSLLNLKGKMKLAGSMASRYQPMLSGLLRRQDKEGFYIFSIRGTLGNPRLSL